MTDKLESPIKFNATYLNGVLTLRRGDYSGWFIEYFSGNGMWQVFDIPGPGGQPGFIGSYASLEAAYQKAVNLT